MFAPPDGNRRRVATFRPRAVPDGFIFRCLLTCATTRRAGPARDRPDRELLRSASIPAALALVPRHECARVRSLSPAVAGTVGGRNDFGEVLPRPGGVARLFGGLRGSDRRAKPVRLLVQ